MAAKFDFEKSLDRLEEIVKKIEGDISIDEALELFNEGAGLSAKCYEILKSAQEQVEITDKKLLSDNEE